MFKSFRPTFAVLIMTIFVSGLSIVCPKAAEADGSASALPLLVSHCREAPKFGGVQIEFRDLRTVAADEVRFSVTLSGETRAITDRGIFSPNVRIDHVYSTFKNVFLKSFKTSCTLEYVHFTDGTSWTA